RTDVDTIQLPCAFKGFQPFPSFFTCFGKETAIFGTTTLSQQPLGNYQLALASTDQRLELGRLRSFNQIVIPVESRLLNGAYEIGYTASQKRFIKTNQFEATLAPNLADPA